MPSWCPTRCPERGRGFRCPPRPWRNPGAARWHPLHRQGQLSGQGADRRLRQPGLQGSGGPARCLYRRAPARRRRHLPGQDQYAADGQWRHAARRLWPCREPLQRRLPDRAFASGSSNGAGTATAASFAAFGLAEETWSSGRGPPRPTTACVPTPVRGRDFGARQLAADPDHGRRRALCPHHGRSAGSAGCGGRRRCRHSWRSLAYAALGARCPKPPKCVRLPIWNWLPRPMPSRASASACRACLSTRMNWRAPATIPASAARPVSASIPVRP